MCRHRGISLSLIHILFHPDSRQTPAYAMEDNVDFVPMSTSRAFLVQLLNIAGLGPIFGALSGALWGPVVYIWIVLGTIFAGGVHDYLSGMLSERNNGASISEIVGKYLGPVMAVVMRIFSCLLYTSCSTSTGTILCATASRCTATRHRATTRGESAPWRTRAAAACRRAGERPSRT